MKRAFFWFLILVPLIFSCSSSKPPDELFASNIEKMVRVDRAMGFEGEITGITVDTVTAYEDLVEVEVRVEGWATHRDLVIGAVVPVSPGGEKGWARWKFFCRKVDKTWVIVEKYKVDEGFEESP